ncbi:hypothetical protein LPC08_17750 [Roseomonas sp. OT10]|uniref:hypothetical protein n=1 Tax=Roseomonas cutis TaxID=2897332 RepID=UPI001E53D4FF|nr:hypothetical protein [Roseomonas sp. OT10]UFN47843.1 hypothetical protein LPC08_17750 [Roseomonas sp. OT10]
MAVEPNVTQHHPNAGATPNRASQEASLDSFPASDAPAQRGETGARAVPPAEMMGDDEVVQAPHDSQPLTFHFAEKAKAKLALEAVVRDAPLDRRLATLEERGEGATLSIDAPPADAARVAELLERAGGEKG